MTAPEEPKTQYPVNGGGRAKLSALHTRCERHWIPPLIPVAAGSPNTSDLDNSTLRHYAQTSIPAGPLSQDTLSLGGSFIGAVA